MRVKKKFLAVLMVLAMAFSTLYAMAAPSDVTVTIDGERVVFEGQQPIITGNRTLVPVRGVFEVLGFYPTWDSATQTATLTRDDYVVMLTIGSYTFTTNGITHTLDVPPRMVANRTLLPLRAVLESVGYDDMDWNSATRTVIIRTGGVNQPPTQQPPTQATPGALTASINGDDAGDNGYEFTSFQQILDYFTVKMQEATPGLVEEFIAAAEGMTDPIGILELGYEFIDILADIAHDGFEEMAALLQRGVGTNEIYENYSVLLEEAFVNEYEIIRDTGYELAS